MPFSTRAVGGNSVGSSSAERGSIVDRLFDISLGQGHELLKSLQNAGLSASHAVRLINEPETARRLVTTLLYPWSAAMPFWWRTPEEQIARARKLWGEEIEIPEVPTDFKPRTPTEVLLLHVPSDVKKMWQSIQAPGGFSKNAGWEWVYTKEFNLLRGVPEHKSPVWVGFDHNFPLKEDGHHQEPATARIPRGCYLAASEVMSAAAQFTGWISAWRELDYPGTDMAGYTIDFSSPDYGKTSIVCLRSREYPVKRIGFRIIPASLGRNAALVRKL